mmetsp:Transcript_14590/g.41696  ORF Transcript_14590/g.41696 Transcript_14590/m.41696 type:complete len:671 (+) Transcript_14590:56-2068(+)
MVNIVNSELEAVRKRAQKQAERSAAFTFSSSEDEAVADAGVLDAGPKTAGALPRPNVDAVASLLDRCYSPTGLNEPLAHAKDYASVDESLSHEHAMLQEQLCALHPALARHMDKTWWLVPALLYREQSCLAVTGPAGAEVSMTWLPRLGKIRGAGVTAGGSAGEGAGEDTVADMGALLLCVLPPGLPVAVVANDSKDIKDAGTRSQWVKVVDPVVGWLRAAELETSDDKEGAAANESAPPAGTGLLPIGRSAAVAALFRAMAYVRARVTGANPYSTCEYSVKALLDLIVGAFSGDCVADAEEKRTLEELGAAFGAALGNYRWPPRQVDGAFRKYKEAKSWWPADYDGYYGHSFLIFDPLRAGPCGVDWRKVAPPWSCENCESMREALGAQGDAIPFLRTWAAQPVAFAWKVVSAKQVLVLNEPEASNRMLDILQPGDVVHTLSRPPGARLLPGMSSNVELDTHKSGAWIRLVGGGWVLTEGAAPPGGQGKATFLERSVRQDLASYSGALVHAAGAGHCGALTAAARSRCASCGTATPRSGRPPSPVGVNGLPLGVGVCDITADQFDDTLARLVWLEPRRGANNQARALGRRYDVRRRRAQSSMRVLHANLKLFNENEKGAHHKKLELRWYQRWKEAQAELAKGFLQVMATARPDPAGGQAAAGGEAAPGR